VGERPAQIITLGSDGGAFESFAVHGSHYFITQDAPAGPLRRFTPSVIDGTDPWNILTGPGLTEYLLLSPLNDTLSKGTYSWTTDKDLAKANSQSFYRNSEGIDVVGDQLFFICKDQKEMFTLNLASNSYVVETTVHGLFDGSPDQVSNIVGDDELLYVTEEGGSNAGGKFRCTSTRGRFQKCISCSLLRFKRIDHKKYICYCNNTRMLTNALFLDNRQFMPVTTWDSFLRFSKPMSTQMKQQDWHSLQTPNTFTSHTKRQGCFMISPVSTVYLSMLAR